MFNYEVQIGRVATALRKALDRYDGNLDLAIASWVLGDAKLQHHLRLGGIERVRNLLLEMEHPERGRVGPDYIDFVKGFF